MTLRGVLVVTLALASTAVARPALAQTWAGGRTTPHLGELFAVDATGETGWLYGQEDLAGDGLGTFKQQEQSIDIRTAYAATGGQRLWLRVYVSDAGAPGGNVTAYFFIDSDAKASTGGSAAATDIDPKFTSDASPGGYEYALGVRGNASVVGLWQWQVNPGKWTVVAQNGGANAEAGTDLDPIRINGNTHGYLQGDVALSTVGVDQACTANLYVRSVNDVAALGAGDLEVGQVGSCVPATNKDGVPATVVPPAGCTSNAECAGGGACIGGKCVFARPCATAADCGANQQCTSDGRCVPVPTGTCTTSADCGDLVCVGGKCSACTAGGSQCGAGQTCSPTGHCVSSTGTGSGGSSGTGDAGYALGPNQNVEGGSCACSLPGHRAGGRLALLALLLPLALVARRRR